MKKTAGRLEKKYTPYRLPPKFKLRESRVGVAFSFRFTVAIKYKSKTILSKLKKKLPLGEWKKTHLAPSNSD